MDRRDARCGGDGKGCLGEGVARAGGETRRGGFGFGGSGVHDLGCEIVVRESEVVALSFAEEN